MTTTKLREYVASAMGTHSPGVVHDCKILGLTSRNGRRYLREAVEQAVSLYEGAPVYIDHARSQGDETRPFLDKFGWFENVRLGSDGLRGDFYYNSGHPAAGAFEGWLKANPKQIGFSHNADGKVREDGNGGLLVEEIISVESVDLVSRPASTQGLFESLQEGMMDEDCPEGECDPDDPGAMLSGLEQPEEPAMDTAPGDDYCTHLGRLVQAIVTDPGMEPADKRKKILTLLDLIDEDTEPDEGEEKPGKGKPGEEGEEEPLEEDDEMPLDEDDEEGSGESDSNPFGSDEGQDDNEEEDEMSEQDKYKKAKEALLKSKNKDAVMLLERLDRYEVAERLATLEAHVRQLCEDQRLSSVLVTPIFVRTLCEARTDEDRLALIEDRRAIPHASKKPVSHAPAGTGKNEITLEELLGGL